ncbi:hypothetical protein HDU79_010310 [Rhizoclosmatium sp. JEL0117]|nr:hypothetical protein HDU79_010310 [Rhizoclosmatium sp. JEL0117]
MISGSTNGCTGDSNINIAANSIVDLLEAKGLSWKSYNEAYPGNCYTGSSSGTYYRKHTPFLSFNNIRTNSARCAKVVNANQLAADEKAGTLANYIFFTPDINDDGHNTNVAYASNWLKNFIEPKLTNPLYANTLFHVTFDEDANDTPTNNIYSLFLGKGIVGAGKTDATTYTHYSALATIEQIFGLGNLGKSDATAIKIPVVC